MGTFFYEMLREKQKLKWVKLEQTIWYKMESNFRFHLREQFQLQTYYLRLQWIRSPNGH